MALGCAHGTQTIETDGVQATMGPALNRDLGVGRGRSGLREEGVRCLQPRGPSSLQPCRCSSPCCCHIFPPGPSALLPTLSEHTFLGGCSLISQRPRCWRSVCACSLCFQNHKLQGPQYSLSVSSENNFNWGCWSREQREGDPQGTCLLSIYVLPLKEVIGDL